MKLSCLLVTQDAVSALHRKNANGSLRAFAAIQYHCDGKSFDAVGDRIGRRRQVSERYEKRFVAKATRSEKRLYQIFPEDVIALCSQKSSGFQSLEDTLDLLRQKLVDLFEDLLLAAGSSENHDQEVYLDIIPFIEAQDFPVDITEFFKAI